MAIPSRFELPISSLTGRRVRPLHHGTASASVETTASIESTAATQCQSTLRSCKTVNYYTRNDFDWLAKKSLAVVTANAFVANFNFASGCDHHGSNFVTTGKPFDFRPLFWLF